MREVDTWSTDGQTLTADGTVVSGGTESGSRLLGGERALQPQPVDGAPALDGDQSSLVTWSRGGSLTACLVTPYHDCTDILFMHS